MNNTKHDQELVLQYFEKHKPLVAIMAPTCTPFGRHAALNYQIYYEGWKRSYDMAAPHGRFAGKIAMLQIKNNRNRHGIPWLVRHPAQTINRYPVGKDGKTAWRRLRGKNYMAPTAEFGECL